MSRTPTSDRWHWGWSGRRARACPAGGITVTVPGNRALVPSGWYTSSASRPAFRAASVKPLTWASGVSEPIPWPTGCRAIFRIRAALLASPSRVYAATCLAALPSGSAQYGLPAASLPPPGRGSGPELGPEVHPARSSTAPAAATTTDRPVPVRLVPVRAAPVGPVTVRTLSRPS